MNVLLLVAFVIVAVSGLIAYIGDWVGRKMGRKRLTLFGLRPRYTAIVISMGAGMLISLVTLFVIFLTSERVQDAFLTPPKWGKNELSLTRKSLADTTHQADKAARELAVETEKLTAMQAKLQSSVNQQLHMKQELSHTQTSLHAIEQRLHTNQRNLTAVGKQLITAQSQYQDVQTNLLTTTNRLMDGTKSLLKLKDEKAHLEGERDILERERTELARQRTDLQEQVQALSTQLEQLAQVLTEFARISFARLAFNSGQEVISGLFPRVAPLEQRKAELQRFLHAADQLIRLQCPEMDKSTTALLFVRRTGERMILLSREEAIDALAERIGRTSVSEDVIVRIAPANNVPLSGPVIVMIDADNLMFPNYTAYIATNEVAKVDITVTAQTSEADILGILVDELLRVQVPNALREKDMILISRRFDRQHPTILPESAVSSIPWDKLLTVTRQVRATPGNVKVSAVARGPIRRFDPLDIDLAVKLLPKP